jgi:hypothetical protein
MGSGIVIRLKFIKKHSVKSNDKRTKQLVQLTTSFELILDPFDPYAELENNFH